MLVGLTASAADAQQPQQQQRRYLPDSSDEDWSFLKDAPKSDVWDPLKYIPFSRDGWFMTLSGEVRYRAEGLRIRATDQRPATIDQYLLQRYLSGADMHFGPHARFFTEVQSGIINGAVRTARPTDQNSIDVHQAFFEWQQTVRPRQRITAKIGRQELAIGSTRLISASPGLNVKRSFDGASLSYRTSSWAVVGVATVGGRIALAAMGDRPLRARGAEEALAAGLGIQAAADRAAEGTEPNVDISGDVEYRSHIARVLTRRALAAATGSG